MFVPAARQSSSSWAASTGDRTFCEEAQDKEDTMNAAVSHNMVYRLLLGATAVASAGTNYRLSDVMVMAV